MQLRPGLSDGLPPGDEVGNNISTSLTLNTGAPQGCVLSPLLYSLFTHDCVAMHASKSIIKFADATTVVGLITNNDETAYREEVRALEVWCQENNFSLNVNKSKEMIVDFRCVHMYIYCILYHLLHLAYATRPSLIHILICTYSHSPFRFVCIR